MSKPFGLGLVEDTACRIWHISHRDWMFGTFMLRRLFTMVATYAVIGKPESSIGLIILYLSARSAATAITPGFLNRGRTSNGGVVYPEGVLQLSLLTSFYYPM